MRKTSEILHLECVLTNDDRLAMSKDLSDSINKMKAQEDKLKTAQAQIKSEIQMLDANINRLSNCISTGKEFRDVECTIEYNFVTGTKTWYRTDTGEEAKNDIISERERQEQFL